MKPRQFRNELARRALTQEQITPQMLEAFGIDPGIEAEGADSPTYPVIYEADEDEIYRGVVPFELQVSMLGRSHNYDCRAIYAATLINDGSLDALLFDVLDECEVNFERLTWEPDARWENTSSVPAPRWTPLDMGDLLAPEIQLLIHVLIEKDAQQQQEIEC